MYGLAPGGPRIRHPRYGLGDATFDAGRELAFARARLAEAEQQADVGRTSIIGIDYAKGTEWPVSIGQQSAAMRAKARIAWWYWRGFDDAYGQQLESAALARGAQGAYRGPFDAERGALQAWRALPRSAAAGAEQQFGWEGYEALARNLASGDSDLLARLDVWASVFSGSTKRAEIKAVGEKPTIELPDWFPEVRRWVQAGGMIAVGLVALYAINMALPKE